MAEKDGELDNIEEGSDEDVSEEPERLPFAKLYRFVNAQPDVALAIILQMLDVLEEKGLLTEEETGEVLREGIVRWKEGR